MRAIGGTKVVAGRLRPEMPVDHATRWLLDCMNPDRREKLDGDQLVLVMRWAREFGSFATAAYMMQQSGFERPRALNREQEKASLQERFLDGVKALERISRRIESLETGG
ncbi:MAG: hypothetical protein IT459_22730 [Planctomycetes bacterium]|nr:hypothetical protein [Planctomycetota bacterium]